MTWVNKRERVTPHNHDTPDTTYETRDFELGSVWECGLCGAHLEFRTEQRDGDYWMVLSTHQVKTESVWLKEAVEHISGFDIYIGDRGPMDKARQEICSELRAALHDPREYMTKLNTPQTGKTVL